MESSAPLGGILVASPCREKVPETNSFRFGEKQQIKVKGYDEPVDAYELEFRDSP
jgi:class 3 adenylate cyclase